MTYKLILLMGLAWGWNNRTFTCLTVRLTRLTVNSFLENVELVIRTLGEFGEDAERLEDERVGSRMGTLV